MNIALRPSGGRGEYELAGSHGTLHVHDLYGLNMLLELAPGIEVDMNSRCELKDGKPRIRLNRQVRYAHPATLIVAAMLLPRPRREKHKTHGENLLHWNNFVVQTIRIDVIRRQESILVSPILIRLENGDGLQYDINFADRMARVFRVWTAASTSDHPIAVALRFHAESFTSLHSTPENLIRSYSDVHHSLGAPTGDMLPLLERFFHIVYTIDNHSDAHEADNAQDDIAEEVSIDPAQARIDRVRQWRLASIRGSSASTFRQNLRQAYDSRCLFTGQRLPRTDATSTPGIDAAHILPWSRYDLDSVPNGLCLNKQCHWAFDEGLLRMTYEDSMNSYIIRIPDRHRTAAESADFDMSFYEELTGIVPRERLPVNEADWPSRDYLNLLNQFLDQTSS